MALTKKENIHEDATLITDYSSIASEAIQKLQTNIAFAEPEHPMKVIAVTSSIQSEGKSTLIVNMANIYAFRGAKVCLVNLDLRRPTVHHFYEVPNKVGVQEFVLGEASIDDIIVHTKEGVDIINSGTRTPFPTKILSSEKMPLLFADLRKKYDYVLVDTAPVLLVTDAIICSTYVDGYIYVAAQHISKKKNITAGLKALQSNRVKVIGLVMTQTTDFDGSESTSDSYHYYYKGKND